MRCEHFPFYGKIVNKYMIFPFKAILIKFNQYGFLKVE